MKIQYLGFLPIIVIVTFVHWKLIAFYFKYRTLNYFDSRVPVGDNPVLWIGFCAAIWMILIPIGFIWALS